MSPGRIALVPPRYGHDVVGGAEAVLREAAHGLAARGWDVEVLTTCAVDHFTWRNVHPPGVTVDGAVTVRRFAVANDTPGRHRRRVEAMLQRGATPSLHDQERWMNDGLRSPELYHHVLDHAEEYRAVVLAPYPFWTTFAVGLLAAERCILMPCLHDEPYARLELFAPLFEGARGLWFLTDPERDLATGLFRLPPSHEVVGCGVPVPEAYDPGGFRRRHGLGERCVVLAGGRREGAKGWGPFVAAFSAAVRAGADLTLVTFGVGDVAVPPELQARVVDLGFVDGAELADAFAAADVYVQPSAMESFSRTVMEAWLAGTLVVANEASAVVAWHCGRSGAGLLYGDGHELVECLRFVAHEPARAATLAAPGRAYVLQHYRWSGALDRMEATLDTWVPTP